MIEDGYSTNFEISFPQVTLIPTMPRQLLWTDLSVIRFTGNDRVKWLNNLVTNDIRKTSSGAVVECFVTNAKGRTLSHGIVFEEGSALTYLSWGRSQAALLLPHFDRYIIREDVQVADIGDQAEWLWCEASDSGNSIAPGEVDSRLIEHPALSPAWKLYRRSKSSDDSAESPSTAFATLPNELEALRIMNRWPVVGIDFDDKNLPQELDRDATAISFTKGCYLGQETVARLDALGQVQKRLVKLKIEAPSAADDGTLPFSKGTLLSKNDQEAGVITSSIFDEKAGGWLSLAYVRRAFFTVGTELTCNGYPALVG